MYNFTAVVLSGGNRISLLAGILKNSLASDKARKIPAILG
jgi:hypothetical protein